MTTHPPHPVHLAASRARLLQAIGEPRDLTFVSTPGNIGDALIHAGTRALLANLPHRETSLAEAIQSRGDTVLLGGGGAWCGAYRHLVGGLAKLEANFERVIVLPSTYDPTIPEIREALANSHAWFFAREEISYELIRPLCRTSLAHDCAFFFDFTPYLRSGQGVLTAFRTDQESAYPVVPPGNQDISVVCRTLETWLDVIADHDLIRTDRAHVTIGAALLGKRVEYAASNYHKVPAIVSYGLRDFPVTRIYPAVPAGVDPSRDLTDSARLQFLADAVARLVPERSTFIFVDDDHIGPIPFGDRIRLPFLERDGAYWGPPADDAVAISELQRMRAAGACFLVFAWTSRWWLDYYRGFHRHLRAQHRCILEEPFGIVFDLHQGPPATPTGPDETGRRSTGPSSMT